MPTPTDFRQVLRQLAGHLHHLHQELLDTGLPAARQSQTGARTTTVKGRPPCDLTLIDTIEHTPINQDGPTPGPSIRGWAYNLAADTSIPTPLPVSQPLTLWCAWLNRHADSIAAMPWAAEAYDELTAIETTLRHQLNPTNPHPQYEQRQTARSIIHRLHHMGHTTITPDTLRQWAHRGKITTITINGRNGYLLSEILDQI